VTETGPRRTRASLGGLVDAFVTLCVVAALLSTVPLLFGGAHWVLDTASFASLQLAVLLAAFAVIAAIRRRWKGLVALLLVALLQGGRVIPHVQAEPPAARSPTIRWLVLNVHTENRQHGRLVELVKRVDPDVIGLVETNERWLRAIEPGVRQYPHRVLHPREDNFGIALYSRLPLIDARIEDFGIAPTVVAGVDVGGKPMELILVHVLPPIMTSYTQARDAELDRIARHALGSSDGVVMAGDFNATPYSRVFQSTFGERGFRRAGGITGTFPATLPAAVRFPLDHVLSLGPVSVAQELLEPVGSDHLPIVATLGWSRH